VTPHQTLALGVRLFAVWYALTIVQELVGFFAMPHPLDDLNALVVVIVGSVVVCVVLLFLWFFPTTIARGLLPHASDAPMQASSYGQWFALGTALLGLWFAASSIGPILRNLSVMYFFRPALSDAEILLSLRAGLFTYVVELVLGLCLLFGATGISKLVWRIRDAGSN
jgi:hypothetical protein